MTGVNEATTGRFKFELGDIVVIDPVGFGKGPVGKIIAQVCYIDGSTGYYVSAADFKTDGVVRHQVSEYEIKKKVTS